MADIALPQTPEPRQGFRVGDIVHVYMGTSAGIRLCLCLCLFSLGLFFVLASIRTLTLTLTLAATNNYRVIITKKAVLVHVIFKNNN